MKIGHTENTFYWRKRATIIYIRRSGDENFKNSRAYDLTDVDFEKKLSSKTEKSIVIIIIHKKLFQFAVCSF